MADTPAPPSSGTLPTPPNLPPEDLSGDKLLRDAPRISITGLPAPVPSLAGIPLLARVGRGGMGAVYYGVHPRLGKHVAIKVLPFHLADQQPELIERFQREARFAARVRSPHLVDVSDVNEEQGLHYIVMEYVHGVSAAGYLKEVKAAGRVGLAEGEALAIAIAAAKGLAAAHAAGIVHRDVKPDNVLIPRRADGTLDFDAAKLADLGLARSDDGAGTLTVTQAAMGTPGYMAPEQGMDVKSAGKPADVFGVGATLYALLSGRAPFKGSSPMQVMMETAQAPHIPIASYRQDLQELTRAIVNRCLEKRPEDRYPDAAALLAELDRARSIGLGHTPPPPSLSGGLAPTVMKPTSLPATPAPAPTEQAGKPRSAGLLVAAAMLAAVGAGAWWWMSQSQQAAPPSGPGGRQMASKSGVTSDPITQSEPAAVTQKDPVARKSAGQGPAEKGMDPEEARTALSNAMPLATEAANTGRWQDVVLALEGPLKALGGAEHPNRALAEGLLARARSILEKESLFNSKFAEGESLLKNGEFSKALAAYRAATNAWPDAPDERKRRVDERLEQVGAGLQVGTVAVAKQAMEKVLQGVEVDKQHTYRHLPLADRNRILSAALRVLSFDPNDEQAENVRDAATGLRMLAVDAGSFDGRVFAFDRLYSTLLERPVHRMLEFPGAWISVQVNRAGPRMWRKWNGEAGWVVRFEGPLMRLKTEANLLFGDLSSRNPPEAVAGIDATTEEGCQALLALPQGARLDCVAVKDLRNAAVVEALAKVQVAALTVTEEGNLEPLRRLTSLRCLELHADADSLAPLEALKDLEALRYDGSDFEGADALARLPKLQHLAVDDVEAKDLAVLPKLGGLRTLVVNGSMEVASLALLKTLWELETLNVSHLVHEGEAADETAVGLVLARLRKVRLGGEKVESLKLLKLALHMTNLSHSLRNLEDLGAVAFHRGLVVLHSQNSSEIRDFSPFGALRHLRYLSLTHNELLESIAFVKDLPRLQYLSLSSCPLLVDLKPLRDLSRIESLVLENCPQVADLSPLLGLPRLRALFLNNCADLKVDALNKVVAFDRRDPNRYLRVLSLPPSVGDAELETLAGPGLFRSMRTLVLQDMGRLTRVNALSPGPVNLMVVRCNAIKSLNLGMLPKTEDILVADCPNLASLALDQGLAKESALRTLRIEKAPLLTDVACLQHAAALRVLEFMDCDALPREQLEALVKALPKCRVEVDEERVLPPAAPLRPAAEIFAEAENFRTGTGVSKDLAKAAALYRKAAEGGFADAQCRLGLAYVNAEGVEKNLPEAFRWMKKASDQDFPDAVHNLGYLYQFGMGVEVDLKKALALYRRAAELGNGRGQYSLGLMYLNGIEVPKDEKAGAELVRKAAQAGFDFAEAELARCYEQGVGVEKDPVQAFQWYSKAANKRNIHAEYMVGYCYEYGIGTKPDMAEAVEWFRKGEARGNANSLNSLGYLYEWGKGVEKDLGKAFAYYGKAIEASDHEQAWHNLGRMYEEGKGIAKDREQAIKCYRKSAEKGYQPAIGRLKELGLSAKP